LTEPKEEPNKSDKGTSENHSQPFRLKMMVRLLNMTCLIIAIQWANKEEIGGINIVGITQFT